MHAVAVDAYSSTVSQLRQLGRFRQAADREKDTAELYGLMANNAPAPKQRYELLKKQAESFQRAGDWYESDDANAYAACIDLIVRALIEPSRTASRCYKDAADVLAEVDEFIPAINLYEKVANHSLTSQLTKYSVKEYWLRAGLCALASQVSIHDSAVFPVPLTRKCRMLCLLAVSSADTQPLTSHSPQHERPSF